MVYRKTLIPDNENHSIEIPEQFFGRPVEIIVINIADDNAADKFPMPPIGKEVSVNDLFADFGAAPDFHPHPSK